MRWLRPRRHSPRLLTGLLVAAAVVAVCVSQGSGTSSTQTMPPRTRPEKLTVAATVYSTELGLDDWYYWGWAPAEMAKGAPASVNFEQNAGWILAHPGLKGDFGGILFRLRAPASFGSFLDVQLDSPRDRFPRVTVEPRDGRETEGGWTEYFLSMSDLNPDDLEFDRVVFRARRSVGSDPVLFDLIALTREGKVARPPTPVPVRSGRFTLAWSPAGPAISPMIYGIAWSPGHDPFETHQWKLGATARRFGGNPTSRYNWELGNAWNTAGDWFYMNVNYSGDPAWSWRNLLQDDIDHGVQTALTVPTIGWVAKDTQSYSFPVSVFGPQQQVAPEKPDAGNGLSPDGKELPPRSPTLTSVPAPPESIGAWVRAIREWEGERGRSVRMYILDNEPMLWNSTHRDVHPEPTTYDELLDRTLRYGGAVRAADPGAVIAGPALWGWPAYLFSAQDAQQGFQIALDRRRHGNVPLLPWWLARLRDHEEKTGEKVLDVVDVHFYPQVERVGGENGGTDPRTAAARIRSTRSLWDPTYRDESWIADNVMLIPRLRKWIEESYPGLGISIGEWNFGAEQHMSGGLAVAETLGRFGELGVYSAFYWTYPPEGSPAFWAFRAFSDFDGQGGRFLDRSVTTRTDASEASLFASRDERGDRLVAVLLNLDPVRALDAHVTLEGARFGDTGRIFVYTGDAAGFGAPSPVAVEDPTVLVRRLPPYSISVLDVQVHAASAP